MPAVKFIPAVSVNAPYMVKIPLDNVTVDPVKIASLTTPDKFIVPEPAVTFNTSAFVIVPPVVPIVTARVVITLSLPLNVIFDVPVKVKLDIVAIDTTVAVVVVGIKILPVVSKVIALVFELVLLKI